MSGLAAPNTARVVVGVGAEAVGAPPCHTAAALSERLGGVVVEFPGGHLGYRAHPDAFAETLHEVLTNRP
jgi:pimeloyl-ACP methyl ester carboxylesterase